MTDDIRTLIEKINTINEGYDERVGRLAEIYDEIKELVYEAGELVRGTSEERAAGAYWLAQLQMALDNDHQYMGSGSHTLSDTIQILENEDDEDTDPEDGSFTGGGRVRDDDQDDEDDEDDGSLAHAAKVNELK